MSMLRTLLGTVARGLRSRAMLTAGSVLLTALAIGSALLGPMFQSASTASYVVTRLSEAPNRATGLSWLFAPSTDEGGTEGAVEEALEATEVREGGPFRPASTSVETAGVYVFFDGFGRLLAKDGACEHLEITSGTCPDAPGEVLLLDRDLEENRVRIGDRIDYFVWDDQPDPNDPGPGRRLGTVRVVGSYTVPAAEEDYWFDLDRMASKPLYVNASTLALTPYSPAPLVTDVATFDDVPVDLWRVRVDAPLDVRPDWSADDLASAVDVAGQVRPSPVPVGTGTLLGSEFNDLPNIAAEVDTQRETARSSIAPAVLSLVLVAMALLLRLLMAASELRLPELALASLRGLPSRQLWLLGLSEPLAVIALAIPVGVVLGPLLAWLLVRAWLVEGLPLPLPGAAVASAVAVVVAAVVVAMLAVGLVLRMSLAGQLTGVRRPTRSSRLAMVAKLLLAAVVIAVLASKLASGKPSRPDATDLVLPVLLAVLVGLVTTALVAAVATWWTRWRRRTRSLAGFVTSRALSRRQEGTLVILPISAAIAVCVFGAGVYASAADWRASVAATRAPAAEVFEGTLPMGQTIAVTRDVDPDGRWLMAATTLQTTGPDVTVVDAPRLPAAVAWHDQWTPGTTPEQIAEAISPTGEIATFSGRRLGLTLEHDAGIDITAVVEVLAPSGERRSVYLGPFAGPSQTLTGPAPFCAGGCQLDGLRFGTTTGQPVEMQGTFRIHDILVDGTGLDPFTDGGWVTNPLAGDADPVQSVFVEDGTLVADADTGASRGIVQLVPGGIPPELPVVRGREARTTMGDGSYAGAAAPAFDPVTESESVPLAGPVGLMVDYSMLHTGRYVPEQDRPSFVLAAADTPDDVRQELIGRGLTPTRSLAAEQRALDQSAYALALRLYAVMAVLVLLMALAGLVVSTGVQLPARRRDAAALRVVGVRRRTVMSAVAREFVIVLGAAAVAGIAAGSLAQYVVLRTVQLGYVEGLDTPRLVATLDWGQIGVWTLATSVLLVLAALLSASLTIRGARGATLRESAR